MADLMFFDQPGGKELGNGVFQSASVGGHADVCHCGGGQHRPAMIRGNAAQPHVVSPVAFALSLEHRSAQMGDATVDQPDISFEKSLAGID